jgi:nonsense-mediated mRNA decay protein 3
MKSFCVVCGAEGETYDGLCKDCYISRGHFVEVPENVDVVLCAHCGAMLIGSHWEHIKDTTVRAVEGAIKVAKGVELNPELNIEDEDERNFRVTVGLHIYLPDKNFEFFDTRLTRVRIKNGCCIECSRECGSYYEAVVQLRAKDRKLTQEEIDDAVANAKRMAKGSHSFVSKVETVKGGVDLYMGKVNDGKQLSSLLATRAGAATTETRTISGKKDGKDVYRWTLLIRMPPFQRGDILPLDGKLWEIRSFTKKSANLQEITSGTRDSRPMEDIYELPVIKKEEALREAVVVSDHGDDLQIMHPENFSTVDIKKPTNYKKGKKEIAVVIYDGDVYPYLLSKTKEEP